ncbi:hypothetical protein IL306_007410 [Fusarium sp. DS 682]|nr:hypothetical protein IL306_007410 [Fusarium sp. DS 682]
MPPSAPLSNPKVWDMALDENGHILEPQMLDEEQKATYDNVMFRMDIHRALLRGTGFYDVLFKQSLEEHIGALAYTISWISPTVITLSVSSNKHSLKIKFGSAGI